MHHRAAGQHPRDYPFRQPPKNSIKKNDSTHIALRILPRPREDHADLDVPAREAELVPRLQHPRAVRQVVVQPRVEGRRGACGLR